MAENLQIKKKLIEICKHELETRIELHKRAMEEAQEEANAHKGAMESRYDSFKEETFSKSFSALFTYVVSPFSPISSEFLIIQVSSNGT